MSFFVVVLLSWAIFWTAALLTIAPCDDRQQHAFAMFRANITNNNNNIMNDNVRQHQQHHRHRHRQQQQLQQHLTTPTPTACFSTGSSILRSTRRGRGRAVALLVTRSLRPVPLSPSYRAPSFPRRLGMLQLVRLFLVSFHTQRVVFARRAKRHVNLIFE